MLAHLTVDRGSTYESLHRVSYGLVTLAGDVLKVDQVDFSLDDDGQDILVFRRVRENSPL